MNSPITNRKTPTEHENQAFRQDTSITVEPLTGPDDGQLIRLLSGFLRAIGEEPLTDEKQRRLLQGIREKRIVFFLAESGSQAIGMCSVARCFSTFACGDVGVFEDFYIEPAFRGKGVARRLAQAAQAWCREQGMASVTVCCAPCDEKMYQALGFEENLGVTYAHLT